MPEASLSCRAGQWAALLEVEANGGVIPDALRKKLGGAAAASSDEPETKPTTSTAGSKGSRKKAAKRARKAAKKAAGRPLRSRWLRTMSHFLFYW